jgi:hypothetical protein
MFTKIGSDRFVFVKKKYSEICFTSTVRRYADAGHGNHRYISRQESPSRWGSWEVTPASGETLKTGNGNELKISENSLLRNESFYPEYSRAISKES